MEKNEYGYFLKYKTIPEAVRVLYADSDKAAVKCGDDSVTYRELVRDTNDLALRLAASGIGKGDRVIINLDRSVSLILAVLGTLYSGAAFIIADRNWPRERLEFIKHDSKAALVLDGAKLEELRRVEKTGDSLPVPGIKDEFTVYYTSGSTGVPKGCVTHHLVHFSIKIPLPENRHAYATMKYCNNIFSVGNPAFVGVGQDIFLSLLLGKTLIFATKEETNDIKLMGERLISEHVDGFTGTTSQLSTYLEDETFREACRSIRRFIILGEKATMNITERISAVSDGYIFHIYGASEITTASVSELIPGQKVHIGSPVNGTKIFLLDSKGQKVSDGEEGEICVGGIPAELGCYVGNRALTAEKYTEAEGLGRIYHTGDIGIRDNEGRISVIGRMDDMRKLHGQRIELPEIEKCMEGFPGVTRAAADIRGEGNDAALYAWYLADKTLEDTEILDHLINSLPLYMIPQRIQQIETFPLNRNGKLDRKALPEIEVKKEPYAAPENETEQEICRAFEEVLNADKIGRNSNFFSCGGSSLLAMHLISRLNISLGKHYSVKDVFLNPTPGMLAITEPEKHEDASEKTPIDLDISIPPELKTIAEDPNTEAVLPVNKGTNRLMILRHLYTGYRPNMIRKRCVLKCVFSREEFKDRVEKLVAVHPALRSEFIPAGDGCFRQIIKRQKKPSVYYKDLSKLQNDAQKRFVSGFRQVLDREDGLFSVALFPISEDRSILLFDIDHSIADGISTVVIQNELVSDNYKELSCDKYIENRKKYHASVRAGSKEAEKYYKDLDIPAVRTSQEKSGPVRVAVEYIHFSKDETGRLMEECGQAGCSLFTWVFLCHARAILKTENKDDIWLKCNDHGRDEMNPEEMRIVGNIVSAKPVHIHKNMKAGDLQKVFLELKEHIGGADTPYLKKYDLSLLVPGIISNDFGEMSDLIEESTFIIDESAVIPEPTKVPGPGIGSSLYLKNGQLNVRLIYESSKKAAHDLFVKYFRQELSSRIV